MRDEKGRFVEGHKSVAGFKKGSKHSQESKNKVSESLRGKTGKDSRRWKGENASYIAKHMWLLKHYGKANKCENKLCTFKNPKRYEWANISKKYKRDRSDYYMLCCSCHRKWDMGRIEICVL